MKKSICVMLLSIMLLCSCGTNNQSTSENTFKEINYDKISRRNNRIVLMQKYKSVSENVEYFNMKSSEFVPDWNMRYSLNEKGNPNVLFQFGEETEYYYNGIIYSTFNGEDISCVLPLNSSFDEKINDVLKRDNTLNYVYYNQKEGYETSTGYAASYWFTITHDVLDEFIYWNIGIGDTIKVDYNLNENYEILSYTYYIVSNPYTENPEYTQILTCTIKFNEGYKFPDFVYDYDSGEKATLTVTENYQKQSQTVQEFIVPINIRLSNDLILPQIVAFKDRYFEKQWDFEKDLIVGDTNWYIFHKDSPELEKYEKRQ